MKVNPSSNLVLTFAVVKAIPQEASQSFIISFIEVDNITSTLDKL